MRITDSLRYAEMLQANQATSENLAVATRKASAGQSVIDPSDDPAAYASAVRRDAALASMTTRSTAARGSVDELTVAENALSSATTIMQQAQSLAVQGANGALSQNDRDSIA